MSEIGCGRSMRMTRIQFVSISSRACGEVWRQCAWLDQDARASRHRIGSAVIPRAEARQAFAMAVWESERASRRGAQSCGPEVPVFSAQRRQLGRHEPDRTDILPNYAPFFKWPIRSWENGQGNYQTRHRCDQASGSKCGNDIRRVVRFELLPDTRAGSLARLECRGATHCDIGHHPYLPGCCHALCLAVDNALQELSFVRTVGSVGSVCPASL